MRAAFLPAHASLPRRASRTSPRCTLAPPPMPPHSRNTPPPQPQPQSPPHTQPSPEPAVALAQALVGRDALHAAIRASTSPFVVVMFHARWCRTCKTLAAKLPRVARDFPTVAWVSIDFAEMENKPLCAELSVKLLPTFHIYGRRDGDGDAQMALLEQFTAGPFGVKRLVERLHECGAGG